MRKQVLWLAVMLVAACVMSRTATRRNAVGRVPPADREAAFARALRYVQAAGFMVAVSDRAGGLLSTQPAVVGSKTCGVTTCNTRDALQVSIAETGEVVVQLRREFQGPYPVGAGPWYQPTREDDVQAVERDQEEILRAVTDR